MEVREDGACCSLLLACCSLCCVTCNERNASFSVRRTNCRIVGVSSNMLRSCTHTHNKGGKWRGEGGC